MTFPFLPPVQRENTPCHFSPPDQQITMDIKSSLSLPLFHPPLSHPISSSSSIHPRGRGPARTCYYTQHKKQPLCPVVDLAQTIFRRKQWKHTHNNNHTFRVILISSHVWHRLMCLGSFMHPNLISLPPTRILSTRAWQHISCNLTCEWAQKPSFFTVTHISLSFQTLIFLSLNFKWSHPPLGNNVV